MKVHFAVIEHRHGNNYYAAFTKDALDSQVAEYCREWWERDGPEEDIPESDRDVIDRYFDWRSELGSESLETTELEVA